MADINGLTIRRASLTASTVQNIVFDDEHIQVISLALMTDGAIVSYLVNDDIVAITDTDSNYLDSNIEMKAVNIVRDGRIEKLSLISDINCDVQWEIRK